MTIRLPRIIVLILCLGVSCSPRSDTTGRHLVIGIGSSLNLGTNNPVYIQRNANVWETFSRLDDFYEPRPLLAESWASAKNGTVWTLRLRRNVVFHDGRSLDAALAIANINRFKSHPEFDYYGVYTGLDSVYARDEYTIVLVFSRPSVDFPNKIGHYFSGVFSPGSFGKDGRITGPIGCGPYRFERSEAGKYDIMEAFPRYYGGKPYFDTVEFRIIPDPLVRVMALIRGDIDMIAHHGGVLPEHLPLLRNNPGIVVDSCDVGVTHYLLFNCESEAFRDRENRAAFARFLNRTEMVDLILRGKGIPAHDYFVERLHAWDRNRFPETPDTSCTGSVAARFRKTPVTLLLSQGDGSNWGYRQIAEYLADYYGKRGIHISIVSLEGGAWQRAIRNGDYSCALYPLSIPTGTPELFVRALAYSRGLAAGNAGNRTHFSSRDVDTLVNDALVAPSLARRDSLYNGILDTIARELPVVPLYHERYYFAYRKGLKHVSLDPFLKPDLSLISR